MVELPPPVASIAIVLDLLRVDDACAFLVARDAALERGLRLEALTDDEVEYERVRAATGPEQLLMDGGRPVRCGGLRAVEPSAGGDLKGWMAARVARLWIRKPRLFEYQAKNGSLTSKKQRWETRTWVDLGRKHSPAHLSGMEPEDGATPFRNVTAPRRTPPAHPPMHLTTVPFDFGGPDGR